MNKKYPIAILSILLTPFISYANEWKLIDMDRLRELSALVNSAILEGLFPIAAAAFVAFIVFSGFKIMTSAGNQKDMKQAKELMIFSVIALIVLLAFKPIYEFIANVLPIK